MCELLQDAVAEEIHLKKQQAAAVTEDDLLIATHRVNQIRSEIHIHLGECSTCTWKHVETRVA